METLVGDELCFPQFPNISCKRTLDHSGPTVFLYVILTCISLLTVMLNLLVIISISHFRQLQNTTNLLLLSLAVSDFFVGLLLLPGQMVMISGCWFLGTFICGVFYFASFSLTSASVGTMVLISVDRYVAICDPLSYTTKVTEKQVKISVSLCWACSVFYNGVIMNVFLSDPDQFNTCYGDCVFLMGQITGVVDIALTFVGPIAVIVVLYMKVFVVAVAQARAMRSHITAVTVQGTGAVTAKKSERKAAKILGIVVVVFLICFCPYFSPSFIVSSFSMYVSFFGVLLLYFNSCINPVIYASFYPWFRRSIKLIVTLKILQPGSCDTHILQKC
uniref:trace amine-associated receptor 13c-like n=1 Tax=Solea senegalensis TaxID=28829 RepID=UPI001CD8309E|nr:trace amine-associated receptor 13c-like [Solea senegalensis]